MKVTTDMIHQDIRKEFSQMRFLPLVFSSKWLLKAFDGVTRRIQVGSDIKSMDCSEVQVPSKDEAHHIRVRIYRPRNYEGKLPAMLYFHGGGYILGSPENSHLNIEKFIKTRPCVVIAPDYRKATNHPYPAALNDCYDTLIWAKENANELSILGERFIVAGHSAGGGLAAAVTLLNRDRKETDIAFQMPFYPMIDDEQPNDAERQIITAVWDSRSNKFAWDKYLAGLKESGREITAYAAPARNRDYTDFPPTITYVGDMEPFYRETVDYVKALESAGVLVKFKEYKGCFHGFDMLDGKKTIVNDVRDFTFGNFADFYDKYIGTPPVSSAQENSK